MDYLSLFLISLVIFLVLLAWAALRFVRARHPCRGLLGIGMGNPYAIQERRSKGPGWRMYALGRYRANRIVLRRNDLPPSTHFQKVVITCPNDDYSTNATVEVDAILHSGTRWKNKLESGLLLHLDDGSWLYKDPFQNLGTSSAVKPRKIYLALPGWEKVLWPVTLVITLGVTIYFALYL